MPGPECVQRVLGGGVPEPKQRSPRPALFSKLRETISPGLACGLAWARWAATSTLAHPRILEPLASRLLSCLSVRKPFLRYLARLVSVRRLVVPHDGAASPFRLDLRARQNRSVGTRLDAEPFQLDHCRPRYRSSAFSRSVWTSSSVGLSYALSVAMMTFASTASTAAHSSSLGFSSPAGPTR